MRSPLTLEINEPGERPREVIAKDGLLIGRHPDCGLMLKEGRVSGRHARIVERDTALAILDLGSNNGTHIDDAHVLREGQHQALRHGMRIQIGRVEIVVKGPVEAPSEASTVYGQPLDENATVAALAPEELEPDAMGTMADGALDDPLATQPEAAPAPAPAPAPPAPRTESPPPPPAPKADPVPSTVAPRPPSTASPAPAAEDSSFSAFDSVALNTIVADAEGFGDRAKLDRMGARLVLVNEAELRVAEVDAVEFTVGRATDCDCTLRNRGVSNQHARIVFSAAHNIFLLEDLGSANGTSLDGAPLSANQPRELRPDSHVRLGTIEAVFVQDLDSDLEPLAAARHDNAVRLLKNRGQVSSVALKQAQKEASEKRIGLAEALLLGQHVSPRDWSRAVEEARVASTVQDLSGGDKSRWVLWVALVIAAAVIALLALPAGRELLGL